jgi:hypothetical protein
MRVAYSIAFVLGATYGLVGCAEANLPDDVPLVDDATATHTRDAGRDASPRGTTSPLPGRDQPPSAPGPPGLSDAGAAPMKEPAPMTPFKRIDVRYPLDENVFLAQCTLDAKTQLVWKTTSSGPDANGRWAEPAYGQAPNVYGGCGAKASGEYPIVITSIAEGALPVGTFLAKCASTGVAHVYRVTGALEGHPAATYQYPEQHAACAGTP